MKQTGEKELKGFTEYAQGRQVSITIALILKTSLTLKVSYTVMKYFLSDAFEAPTRDISLYEVIA